jgi:histidinol-phosphate/aromatic aminotransferase/cobyric acid decarboxylase-like protein/choline kinase
MQAIILAAGLGRRLGALTRDSTKFMLPVNGRPLAAHTLDALAAAGVERVVLVVGHGAAEVRSFVGSSYRGMPVAYVENEAFARTNNIYSLLLAGDVLEADDSLVLESDVIFDPSIVVDCVNATSENLAVLARYESWMDGTVAVLDDQRSIAQLVPKSDVSQADRDRYFKTVNIYRFSRAFSHERLVPYLTRYVVEHGVDGFYEQVLQVLVSIAGARLDALDVGDRPWYEIDDAHDLDVAETLFADANARVERFGQRFGGYWRFGKLEDFAYLANPFFPPQRLVGDLRDDLERLVRAYPSGQRTQRLLASRLFGCEPHQVLVGNGASELLSALLPEFDGRIAVSRPTFEEYPRLVGADRLLDIPTDAPDFGCTVVNLIASCKAAHPAALVLVNPDNPSGQLLQPAEVERLADELATLGTRLILDESFVDFVDGSLDHSFLHSEALAHHPNLVVVRSLGKSYGVPGLRLGVVATADADLLARVNRRLPIWNVNSLAEWFLQRAPRYQAEYLEACKWVAAEREYLTASLARVSYLRPIPSATNFVLCELAPGWTSRTVARHLLAHAWILIKNCSGKPGLLDGEYIRLAVRDRAANDRLLLALMALPATMDARDAVASGRS